MSKVMIAKRNLRRGDAIRLVDGDLIGFSGKGLVSDLINISTFGLPRWGLSHIGIVSTVGGVQYIFESTTLNGDKPCALEGSVSSGVQAHPIADILTRPGKVWLYKLTRSLLTSQRNKLRVCLLPKLGTPYDYHGAAHTGGFLLRLIGGVVHKQELSRLFCSELVAYALTQVRVVFIMNASSQSPNSLVRRLNRSGITQKRVRLK